jgi:serine-type D-Ala-D-Ala carboxypeptidase/endopeptidase (penicillin-binding protein 4)
VSGALPVTFARAALLGVLALLPVTASLGQSPARQALPAPVAGALARAGIPENAVGVVVQEVDARDAQVLVNADSALNPASTMKLVTTFAALELLGPSFAWRTELLSSAEQRGDVLDGDLIVRGSGDPRLTHEAFWVMLRALRARGIREIRGDLVLDRSAFQVDTRDASVFDNEPTRPYNTPPDALLMNFRAVMLLLVPDPLRQSIVVTLEPPLPQVSLTGTVKADAGAECDNAFARLGLDVQNTAGSARVAVGGSFPSGCGERIRPISVLSHREFVFGLFQQLWRESGGTFAGQLRDGTAAAGARVLASHTSAALSEIVRDVNKWSNNVMAQQVYLAIGAQTLGAPATWAKSSRAIADWAKQRRLALPELVLENGSGLSRIERITPRGLSDLLLAAFRSAVMPELMSSLPLVASDGTMRKRLANSAVAGQAHIKTGSLNDVRAIAGYVLDARGRRTVVVMIVNHPKALAAQPAFDALLSWAHQRP